MLLSLIGTVFEVNARPVQTITSHHLVVDKSLADGKVILVNVPMTILLSGIHRLIYMNEHE